MSNRRLDRLARTAAVLAIACLAACGGGGEGDGPDGAAGANAAVEIGPPAPATETAKLPVPPAAPASSGAPKIEFEAMSHDFGVIPDGKRQRTSFAFTNVGTGDLLIRDVRASCGCTTPALSKRRYAPGESGRVDAVFDPKGKKGPTTTHVTLVTNALPESQKLQIISDVRALLRHDRFQKFDRIPLGARRIVSFLYTDPDLVVSNVKVEDAHISARLVDSGVYDRKEGAETLYRADVEVTVDKDIPWGPLLAKTLTLDAYGRWREDEDPVRISYSVFLSGRVFGAIESKPAIAALNRLNFGQSYRKQLQLWRSDGAPFTVKGVELVDVTIEGMQVSVRSDEASGGYKITVEGVAPRKSGNARGWVEVRTDVPGEEVIRIPITGGVRG